MTKEYANGSLPTIGCISGYLINENEYKISDFQINYSGLLLRGIQDFIKENNANLMIFSGSDPNISQGYNYQLNTIYDLIRHNNLDGLIILTGLVCNYLDEQKLKLFFERFLPMPVISVAVPMKGCTSILVDNKSGMKEAVKHLIQVHNRKKIAFITGPLNNHEAQARLEAYKEALAECNIPLDNSLIAQGFFYRSSGIDAIRELMDKRKVQFDAIVSSNDDMAFSVIEELKRRGLQIPLDIIVTGFDDHEESKYFNPTLTTVRQPLLEMGRKSAEAILRLIEGQNMPEKIEIPTHLVVRSSCGCYSQSIQMIDSIRNNDRLLSHVNFENIIDRILYDREEAAQGKQIKIWFFELKNIFEKNNTFETVQDEFLMSFSEMIKNSIRMNYEMSIWQNILTLLYQDVIEKTKDSDAVKNISDIFQKARIMLSDMTYIQHPVNNSVSNFSFDKLSFIIRKIIPILDLTELTKTLAIELPKIGIKSCFISLFENEITHGNLSDWNIPEKIKLIMAYNKSGTMKISEETYNPVELLPRDVLSQKENFLLTAQTLFVREHLLGFLWMEYSDSTFFDIEILRQQISSTIMACLLFRDRQEYEEKLLQILKELETTNEKLNILSFNDEMTGLYNRRGFLTFASNEMNLAKRLKTNGIMFFADLDGLKHINDTYGHHEGDFAIINAANILKESFRSTDIIARLGGDEFIILAVNVPENFTKEIVLRIEQNINIRNQSIRKEYLLSMSIGYADFTADDAWTFDQIMSKADQILYEQKKMKKTKKNVLT